MARTRWGRENFSFDALSASPAKVVRVTRRAVTAGSRGLKEASAYQEELGHSSFVDELTRRSWLSGEGARLDSRCDQDKNRRSAPKGCRRGMRLHDLSPIARQKKSAHRNGVFPLTGHLTVIRGSVILKVSNYEKGFRTLFRGPFSFALG
jgi:hypothetical protein